MYSHILSNKNNESFNNKLNETNNDIINYNKNGWSVLKKTKYSNNIVIYNSVNYEKNRKKLYNYYAKLENKQCNNALYKMINNWNSFRDYDIITRGDLSIYFNYKYTLQNMYEQDMILFESIDSYNICNYSDMSDDEENNKHLIY
jgi:hypothetical protein